MERLTIKNRDDDVDYLDRLTEYLPLDRSLTSFERLLIVFIVSIFVSVVGCCLLCLICPRSPLRRRYFSKKNINREDLMLISTKTPTAPRHDSVILPAPPRYESIIKSEDISKINKKQYSHLSRKSSHGTTSDSDGVVSNGGGDHFPAVNGRMHHSSSTRPFARIHLDLQIDSMKNLFVIHVTHVESISKHLVFDEPADYFIRFQLLNNKLLKKFQDIQQKRRSNMQISVWKKQQERTSKHLIRTGDQQFQCDESFQFSCDSSALGSMSIRCLFFCTDRSGLHDYLCQAIIPLHPSMISINQQIIELKDAPQLVFGEAFLGLSYLPTSERLTIKVNQLRCFYKLDKEFPINAYLIITLFHQGRRFFQKKFPSIQFDPSVLMMSKSSTTGLSDIEETITQNIPITNIQLVYIHCQLVIHLQDQSVVGCPSFLLGKQTFYEFEWQKILEQPRQNHLNRFVFYE